MLTRVIDQINALTYHSTENYAKTAYFALIVSSIRVDLASRAVREEIRR
jgi:hypothetical protein